MGSNPEYANGEVIANKFVVEGFLGESPAGRIFVAAGNPASQRTAVKFYKSEVSARLLAAPDFFLKASVMTEIEHDNLCACYDVQEEMGNVFVARAFAEGVSFEEWARKNRSESNYYTRGLELLWQATQGLAALHERTRHLNIHPGNVIVGPLVAKLCDWDPRALGNTEMTPEALPARAEYAGYRAPEASGKAGGFLSYPSTDLYSIAALLFRLVKGEHPSGDATRTFGEARGLDKDLSQFFGKTLHPRPEERIPEASMFSDALWDLQGAMQRLQEQNRGKSAGASKREEPAPQPRSVLESNGDATLSGTAPAKTPSGNDTFFNFFPQDNAPASPTSPKGDTLFGAPPVKSTPNASASGFGSKPLPYAQPQPSFAPAPKPAPAPAKSGLEALEGSGTFFGSDKTAFPLPPSQSKTNPGPSKPMAVSLSSLEKDPMDMTNAGDTGFTQYGFKGAGENRTGEFRPDRQAPSARRKLGLLLIGAGALVLILGLAALFLYLRNTAAPKEAAEPARNGNDDVTLQATAQVPPPPAPAPLPHAPAPEAPPYPEEAAQNPAPVPAPPTPRPKPPRPPKAPAPEAKQPETPRTSSSVSMERQAELMRMVESREYPPSASERLRAADELNDLGKTAEANVVYGKTLLAADVTSKQKVLAFGGLAITFQKMGMKDQALDAVNRLLEINPRNAFALKLRQQLK
jgi:hypothetical protein